MINLNLNELIDYKKNVLLDLISEAGNQSHLARMLGVSKGVTDAWVQRGQISRQGAKRVEKHEKLGEIFTAKKLRPDL